MTLHWDDDEPTRFDRLLHVDHRDPDVRARGRNALVVLAGVLLFGLAATVALLRVDGPGGPAAICLAVTLLSVPAAWLVRRGHVGLATGAFLVSVLAGNALSPLIAGGSRLTPVYLTIPAALAFVLLRPVWAGVVVAASLGLALAIPVYASGPGAPIQTDDVLVSAAILIAAVAVSTGLGMWGQGRAVREADRERRRAQNYAGELSRLNADLEARVVERTESLSRALDRQEQLTAELAARHDPAH